MSGSLEYLSLQSVGSGDPRCIAELEKCLAVNLGEQLVASGYILLFSSHQPRILLLATDLTNGERLS